MTKSGDDVGYIGAGWEIYVKYPTFMSDPGVLYTAVTNNRWQANRSISDSQKQN